MSDSKKAIVLGGGTFFHVKNHLSLCAPAFGTTARKISSYCLSSPHFKNLGIDIVLTKMADSASNIETNEDVARYVDKILEDTSVKVVFFNVAMCDFSGQIVSDGVKEPVGKHAGRLKTSDGNQMMELTPSEKVLGRIRKERKDITLVGFKTTCGATEDEQYLAGLALLKKNSCNLVLANDTKTRVNMIITPEEARYHVTKDRDEALYNLVEMAGLRSHLTFTRSTVVRGLPIPWSSPEIPDNLRQVVDYCVKFGAYKPFMGATVGHFAVKLSDTEFLTSRRKTNFNDIDKLGLVKIKTDGPDSVLAYGSKPSVGGQSQRIVFKEHQGMDCIVHFHCPILPGSFVPIVSQREYECGSHECGQNTSNGLKTFELEKKVFLGFTKKYKIKAVFLENHGPNIVFSKNTPWELVVEFIAKNFDLRGKTGGYVS